MTTTTATTARGRVRVEPGAKRVRAYLAGRLVADTTHPLYVWEIPYYPVYYLPVADVVADLVPTGQVDRSPSRGDAERHDVRVGGGPGEGEPVVAPGAALVVVDSPLDDLASHVRLDWGAMDAWFEEDEEVFTHPRSPYTRVDVLPSSRRVRVLAGDVVLADTTRAHALFETGLPTRWYIPKVDVRLELLEPSDSVSHCPYKGQAAYYSLRPGEGRDGIDDVAWTYPTPLPESAGVAGLLSFYPDKVTIEVEGEDEGG